MAGVQKLNTYKINQEQFYGGNSVDYKIGIANSFYFSQAMDFRKKPSQMTILPAMRDIAGSSLTDLVIGMETAQDGSRYMVGTAGYFYKLSTTNVISTIGQLNANSGSGIVYDQVNDTVYLSGQTTLSTYGLLANSPTLTKDNFAQSASVDPGCTQLYNASDALFDGVFRNTAAASYTVKTSLSETATDLCKFQPDIDPFYSFKVYVIARGTGNWTFTLHNPANVIMATVTVPNAGLTNGALNEFKFATPIRAKIKPNATTYHWHVTSTVGDGTVQVVTAGDLSTANFQLYAYSLIQQNNGLHPMTEFNGKLCIGNGNYLATYDFSTDDGSTNTVYNQSFVRNALVFPPGYECTGLSVNDQMLVIAMERRSANASRSYQTGRLYFWDGVSAVYNFFIDVPMGAPYGVYTFNNITYFYVNGSMYAWAGAKTVMKVRTVGYTDTEYTNVVDTTMAYPNMMTSRNNILMVGYPSTTTNANINVGVYSWGAIEMQYPNAFGFSYVNSAGIQKYTTANQLKQGMVQSYGDTMYLSYSYIDTGSVQHYGLDVVDNFSAPAPKAEFQSLIYDGSQLFNPKELLRYRVSFLPLPTGVTITPKYKFERNANWTYGTAVTTGGTSAQIEIDKRFYEAQWGFDIVCSGATVTPTITAITAEIDPLPAEVDL